MSIILLMSALLSCYLVVASNPWVKVSGADPVHEWMMESKTPLVHAMILLVVCVTSLVAEGYFLINMLSRIL